MSQIVAGLYEIEKQIGAGGGGIVYLGRHLRLDKQIVLKADKRTLNTAPDALRREVNILKDLSNTYIPQVYDFVQEDGNVYTVMDFVEGESLDKLIGRKQIPQQSQVIRWACQLLSALQYLHNRPPYGILHGDIKPANIMLRPNGDICLIDFNIALALGEDGAVKVGFSRGYASPEHYGADYISSNRAAAGVALTKNNTENHSTVQKETGSDRTVVDTDITEVDDEKTVVDTINKANPAPKSSVKSTTNGQSGVMLDVRSDIYSLGATLYHLISGKRPAQDARDVEPLDSKICSPAVSAIIRKAMSPQPDDRYQTAEEMLNAFLGLYKNDKRVIRHNRNAKVSATVLTAMFLVGGACTFIGMKQMQQRQEALTLAEYSANALSDGDVSKAVSLALQAIPKDKSILNAPVTAEAQKALTDALGVYNLSDGFKAMDVVSLPSAPFDISVSPEGTYFAAIYAYETTVYDMKNLTKKAVLPMLQSALSDVVFTDENHIVYAGDNGVTAYDIEGQRILWSGEEATMLTVSGDGSVVAAIDRDAEYAVVYRVSDGEEICRCSFDGKHMLVAANDIFADPQNDIFALNNDGSMLAVSFDGGGLYIYDLINNEEDIIVYDESDYSHFEGGFSGRYFAFSSRKNDEVQFGIIDTKEAVYVGGYSAQDNILLKVDESGIYLAEENLLVKVDPDNMQEKELAYTNGLVITAFDAGTNYVIVATDDNGFGFYDRGRNLLSETICDENCDFVRITEQYAVIGNRNENSVRVMKLEDYSESQLLVYDADYSHDEARISSDGKRAMLFSIEGFRIYDMDGNVLADEVLPDASYIYDQQFRKEDGESWLEVIWYDGTVRCYSDLTGELISEEKKEAPDKQLDEEFFTDKYRIESSLHTAPVVYDIDTDKKITELETDSYLTYVTELKTDNANYIITEYISAAGERYGLLLDEDLQKLAYLPELCDVSDNMAVFDYASGNLRQCRLYSLQELITLGESY